MSVQDWQTAYPRGRCEIDCLVAMDTDPFPFQTGACTGFVVHSCAGNTACSRQDLGTEMTAGGTPCRMDG